MVFFVFEFNLFFKQKTTYEMRISDWSSDVCSSDLAFVHRENFAVNVVVARINAHGEGAYGHAFDDAVGIEAQNVAVFESARLAFIGIAHQVFLARQRARHEAPLQAGGEPRAAASAQTGRLDFGDDVLGLHARGQDLAQGDRKSTRLNSSP